MNLQGACHNVVVFQPMWQPVGEPGDARAIEEQAIGRVYRSGQDREVIVKRLVCFGPQGQDQPTLETQIVTSNKSSRPTQMKS